MEKLITRFNQKVQSGESKASRKESYWWISWESKISLLEDAEETTEGLEKSVAAEE